MRVRAKGDNVMHAVASGDFSLPDRFAFTDTTDLGGVVSIYLIIYEQSEIPVENTGFPDTLI